MERQLMELERLLTQIRTALRRYEAAKAGKAEVRHPFTGETVEMEIPKTEISNAKKELNKLIKEFKAKAAELKGVR